MNEKQLWRPPLAPKPSPAALHLANAERRELSPALRGASLAFSPASSKPTTAAHPQDHNAALAAAAAGRARAPPTVGNSVGARTAASPARGRSELTLDLDQAAKNLQTSANNQHAFHAPAFSRTASEIAARAASASTSPARNSESTASRGSSPHKRIHQSASREASSLSRGRTAHHTGDDALLGATASMSISPSSGSGTPYSDGSGKLDMRWIASLAPSSTAAISPPAPTAAKSSTAAARAANAEAGERLKEAHVAHSAVHTSNSPHIVSQKVLTAPHPVPAPPVKEAGNGEDYNDNRSSAEELLTPVSPKKHLPAVPITRHGKTLPNQPGTPSMTPRDTTGGFAARTLADAMVASSLASSRVQSPAPASRKHKPPPPPLRRSRSLNTREQKRPAENALLKPMPVRPLRQTLRKQSSKETDDEDGKRGRKHLLRKHPNMHHEGDRKRWRDKVTERERKRYEGVWAANRGLLHQYEVADLVRHRSKGTVPEDLVVNVIVRDIWERSRLPRDILEEIWDLATDDESQALSREEFVVGMWLIDQRLKGRKLPVKVSPSVWSSVRHTSGVKISSKPL